MVIKIENIGLFDDGLYREDEQTFEMKKFSDGKLIKSKIRVQKHGEVFTPNWMVRKMLSVPEIQEKIKDLHATFLEPAAGEGAFLIEILHQKLENVDHISNKKDWQTNAMWALMSIYAIEYMEDNLVRAHQAMIDVLVSHYQRFFQRKLSTETDFFKSARLVVRLNVVQGNTLTKKNAQGEWIMFSQWKQVGEDKVLREPFTYNSLFDDDDEQLDLFEASGQLSLFDEGNMKARKYRVSRVTRVYKEEME